MQARLDQLEVLEPNTFYTICAFLYCHTFYANNHTGQLTFNIIKRNIER